MDGGAQLSAPANKNSPTAMVDMFVLEDAVSFAPNGIGALRYAMWGISPRWPVSLPDES
jgi:hypothetical protein